MLEVVKLFVFYTVTVCSLDTFKHEASLWTVYFTDQDNCLQTENHGISLYFFITNINNRTLVKIVFTGHVASDL